MLYEHQIKNTQREKNKSSNYTDFHYAQNKIKLNNIHKQKRGRIPSLHICIHRNQSLFLSLPFSLSYEALSPRPWSINLKKNKNNLDLGKKIINHRSYILLNCSVRNTFKLELYIIIYIYMYMCILFLIPWQFYKNYTTILSSHPQHTILVLVLSLKSPQGGSQGGGVEKIGGGIGGRKQSWKKGWGVKWGRGRGRGGYFQTHLL